MHLILILAALGLAWKIRLRWSSPIGKWADRWQRSLLLFLFPPLLLIITSLAVLFMGPGGEMVGFWDGWLSYFISISFLVIAAVSAIKLAIDSSLFLQQIRTYPLKNIASKPARILNTPALFSAVIGFWNPEFTVSTGLLNTLNKAHLEAVISHEKAHYYYRDTFWFFWLGWLRRLTFWLPQTKALWEELLVLRELRADAHAAREIDSLLLAEALLLVASYPHQHSDIICIIGAVGSQHQLAERIEALLTDSTLPPKQLNQWFWSWLLFTLSPLIAIPFHN
ncbi:peptidase M56 BlaR1 [Oscillatoriales cyanobacterium USR001]|nr:peptidase M56 BlaR1 [Oscillatoriales cyanobacterium USR001]